MRLFKIDWNIYWTKNAFYDIKTDRQKKKQQNTSQKKNNNNYKTEVAAELTTGAVALTLTHKHTNTRSFVRSLAYKRK